jgi:isocitrate dehydrogenase (NAD+)
MANPTAMMFSAVMMLRHLKETAAAEKLKAAVEKVYAGKKNTTKDVGGTATTDQFTDAVIAAMN